MSHDQIPRRRFLQLSGAAAAGSVLAAHGGLDALASTLHAQVTVNFWTPGGSKPYCSNFNNIGHDFTKRHPNIAISKAQCYSGQQDYRLVLLTRIAAGNPPDATIWWDSPVTLGAVGAVEPLDDLMATSQYSQAKDWPASALASCQFGGKTWGLPLTGSPYAVWYNADWFAKKGISTKRENFPKTWDELRKLSKEFTQWKGGKLVAAGYVPFGTVSQPGTSLTATIFAWSGLNGGQIYDAPNKKYTIDSDANVAMCEYMVSWLNEEYKGDFNTVNRSANWSTYPDAKNRPGAFAGGTLAMVEEGFWFCGDFYAYSAPTFHDYNVASYPVGPGGTKSVTAIWPNWAVIPRGAQHKEEAFMWLDYLGGVGVKKWFELTPDLPTNRNIPTNLVPAITVQKRGRAFGIDLSHFFHHQLDTAVSMWNSPIQDFAWDQINKALQNIMYKTATPKAALASAQAACQSRLKRTLKSS